MSKNETKSFYGHGAGIFNRAWAVDAFCMLCLVMLSGSALNCLFAWLAYGNAWDMAGLIYSLALAIIVYFGAFDIRRQPSMRKRVTVALACLFIWAIFLPLVLKLAGHHELFI